MPLAKKWGINGLIDHDRLYKELLQTFFREFMELFFPEAAAQLDFTQAEFLSEEVVTDITGGTKRRLDILVKTLMKEEEMFILVHMEPQSYYEEAFPERMFLYASRLYEKYRLRVLPVAVLSHNKNIDEPDVFGWHLPFLEVLQFRYYRLQLRKYNWRDFTHSNNPVAAALLSSMGYNEDEKIQMKLEFVRMMTQMQLDPARMELLMVFFESYLPLKKEEELLVAREIERIYGEGGGPAMKWETARVKLAREEALEEGMEKGLEKGLEEGMEKGKEQVAAKLLELGLDPVMIQAATGLSPAELAALPRAGSAGPENS
ncbi:MAG: transposase [Paenibacillaceae bacterium]|nr:transposase [Paenibacillaceae bacterium]